MNSQYDFYMLRKTKAQVEREKSIEEFKKAAKVFEEMCEPSQHLEWHLWRMLHDFAGLDAELKYKGKPVSELCSVDFLQFFNLYIETSRKKLEKQNLERDIKLNQADQLKKPTANPKAAEYESQFEFLMVSPPTFCVFVILMLLMLIFG